MQTNKFNSGDDMNLAKHIDKREWFFYHFERNFYFYRDGIWHRTDFVTLSDARKYGALNLERWPSFEHENAQTARVAIIPGHQQSFTINILKNKEE